MVGTELWEAVGARLGIVPALGAKLPTTLGISDWARLGTLLTLVVGSLL